MNWVIEIVVSSIISSIFTAGILSAIITKLQKGLELHSNGIKRIYPYGKNIKSLEKTMKNCTTIKILGFSALGITHSYRRVLTNHLAKGGKLEFLLAKEDSEITTEASLMENRGTKAIANSIGETFELLKAIKIDSEKEAEKTGKKCGDIEVRQYNTEIRNQLIICINSEKEEVSAWMSILLPPLPAVECKMIEYSEPSDCVRYYDTIWNRHETHLIKCD